MIKTKIIRNVIKFFLALTFFVPLIVLPSSFIFPFIVPKVIAFRILVLIMTGGFVLLLASNWEKYRPKFSWLHLLIFLFFVAMSISTVVGVDPYSSFWDNHERMLGLFTVTHYFLYYYIASQVLSGWKDWRNMFRVFLLGGNIVMIIALIQKFIDPNFILNQGGNRVHSTLGNPIYVSGYGMFLMFVGALLFIKEKTTSTFWKFYALFSSALGFIGIFLGGTRGTFLGLIASIVVALLIYAFFQKGQKKLRWGIGISIVAMIALVGSIFVFRNSNFFQKIPVVDRLAKVDITEGTANTRIMAWGAAIEAWKEKPVFGWGHRNFYFAFNKYYDPEFLRHGYGETWFDNAHNIVVNTLATKGVFGILAYLGIYVATFFTLWHAYHRDQISIHMFALSFAFMIGHLVHNVFVFEDPTSYLYFFFYLAFIEQMTRKSVKEKNKKYKKNVSYGLTTAVSVIVLIGIYTTNINPAKANMTSLDAMRALQTGNQPVQSVENALSVPTPHKDVIRDDMVQTISKVLPKYIQADRKEEAKKLFNIAYSEISENQKLHPRDIRTHFKKAQMAQQGAAMFNKPEYMNDAKKALEKALEYSPNRQQVQFMLANLYSKLGQMNKAEELLIKAVKGDPTIGESWWRLAMLYKQMGKDQKVIETIETAREKGVKFSDRGEKIISQIMPASSSIKTTSTVKK